MTKTRTARRLAGETLALSALLAAAIGVTAAIFG